MTGKFCAVLVALSVAAALPVSAGEPAPKQVDRTFQWLMGGYVALQLTDVYLTQRGANMGMSEENPVFSSGSSVIAAKAVLAPLTAYGLTRLHRKRPKLAKGLAIGLNALYLGVAVNNMRVLNEAD